MAGVRNTAQRWDHSRSHGRNKWQVRKRPIDRTYVESLLREGKKVREGREKREREKRGGTEFCLPPQRYVREREMGGGGGQSLPLKDFFVPACRLCSD